MTDDEKERLWPRFRPAPEKGTFEIGLVLGGTVSAGAYTAGALDLLIEALDAWHDSKPPHEVKLTVAAGSSGGAVCAALLGLLSNRRFTHASAPEQVLLNPNYKIDNQFWNVWVDTFELLEMLKTDDLNQKINEGIPSDTDAPSKPQRVPGLLNTTIIDKTLETIIKVSNQAPTISRPWIEDVLRVGVTVTNLRGVPYKMDGVTTLRGYTGDTFLAHDDFPWFAVPTTLDPTTPLRSARPDEFAVADHAIGFEVLAHWAAASGAMPIGLSARSLHRPVDHYRYRPRIRVDYDQTGTLGSTYEWPEPYWPAITAGLAGDYVFSAVDGGCFNNNPVTLVHSELAGYAGSNPPQANTANRAMLMIDPLVDQVKPVKGVGLSLVAVLGSIVGTFVGGARYLTADLERFGRNDVYSRFQLIPNREIPNLGYQVGEPALAGTDLDALGGWCSRAYRVHDYLLGRANMLDYLRGSFTLAGDNPLFENWNPATRQRYAVDGNGEAQAIQDSTPKNSYFLPIIPNVKNLTASVPQWPKNQFDPSEVKSILKDRIIAVVHTLRQDNFPGLEEWILDKVAISGIVGNLVDNVIEDFRKSLVYRQLL